MKNGKGHAHSRFFRALTRGTDNLRLRTKMILLSITCVLIPVIATNCIFWSMVYSSEQTRINSQIKDVYVGTQYRLDSLRESVATMIATFYTNSGVYEFLDREYESELEFFNASRQFSEAFNVVYGNNTYIKKYVLYADNDSLVNGGRVGKLSSVRDTDWYRYYKESGRESAVYAYYDDLNDVRTISVIRRLGYGRKAGDRECLIKLDLSYSYYSRMLSQQQTNTDIYICSGDYIIFSNTDSSNGAVPFRPVSELSTESAAQTFRYNIFDTEWMVYMYQSEESLDMTGLSMIADRWPLLMGMVLINLLLPTAALLLISRSITSRLRLLAKHMEMVEDETFEEITIYP